MGLASRGKGYLRLRFPSGTALLLVGSGIYWILSSQLIASFTVLAPQLFSSIPSGVTMILIMGVISCAMGLSTINEDLNQLSLLMSRIDGWVYLIPLLLAAGDLTLTNMGLSTRAVMELNPLVDSALQAGPLIFAAFFISYMTLAEGLALLMLYAGDVLFPSRLSRFLPFTSVCGAASFGLASNVAILAIPGIQGFAYFAGAAGGFLLSAMIFQHFRRREQGGSEPISLGTGRSLGHT